MTQKFYLTQQGLDKFKKEQESLKKLKFSKTGGEIPKLLHSEDVNSEYLSYQEDIGLLDKRMVDLENILKNAELIKAPPKAEQRVINLGARVQVEIDGQTDEFDIVGTLEANPALGKISNESPVGRSLLGHKVGDQFVVSSPIKISYKIKKIKYK